ncbi:MAG: GNAT family N-acetyltransferase [Thermoplasmata archaeon]
MPGSCGGPSFRIRSARSAAEVAVVRSLFEEYAASLGVDLCFQGFDRELRELPGEYVLPRGALFFASVGGRPAGCVAVRPLPRGRAELKRLYVRPRFRGSGIGRTLALAAIRAARRVGYRALRLDTLPAMGRAQALYVALGFREISAYRPNPVPGARYFELDLTVARADRRGTTK